MSLNGGYAMIKFNSTQEELAIAYKSKRPALFYDENQRAHWAVIEETATESVDEETQEPITTYKYSYRLLDEASGGGSNLLEDIVDKNGNKRFIEGSGTPESSSKFTSKYCRWSLSGTHLMCVLSGTLNANEILPAGTLATFTVPDYIGSKIFPIWGNHIEIKEPYLKTSGGSGSTMNVWVDYANNNIKFNLFAQVASANVERYFRIQFDLLIDSE